MNYPKYLVNSFAILGVISLIFFACASSNDTNNTIVTGKYQISSYSYGINSVNFKMDVLDTETGVVKHYRSYSSDGDYTLIATTSTQ